MLYNNNRSTLKLTCKEEKPTFKINLGNVVAAISLFIIHNYILSYIWIRWLIETHHLEFLSIFSEADFIYPFLSLNIKLIFYSLLNIFFVGYVVIFGFPNRKEFYYKNLPNTFKKFTSSSWLKKTFIVLLILFLIGFLTYLLIRETKLPLSYYSLIFIVLAALISYMFFYKYLWPILTAHVVLSLAWSIIFAHEITNVVSKTMEEENTRIIQFTYLGKQINNKDTLDFSFFGSKFIIMKNKKSDKSYLFPVDEINNFEIGYVKKDSCNTED